MTETTTPDAATPEAARTDTPLSAATGAKPARRWATVPLVLIACGALVVGLGGGFAGGWAVASAHQPTFGGAPFPGGARGEMPEGAFPGDGGRPLDHRMPGDDAPRSDGESPSETDSGDDATS